MGQTISWARRLSALGTILAVRLRGTFVGSDGHGQRYFRLTTKDWAGRESRLVLYAGEPEASKIPPVWRVWLSHADGELTRAEKVVVHAWQKTHLANQTGTEGASLPSGHVLGNLGRSRILKVFCAGGYRAWTPPTA